MDLEKIKAEKDTTEKRQAQDLVDLKTAFKAKDQELVDLTRQYEELQKELDVVKGQAEKDVKRFDTQGHALDELHEVVGAYFSLPRYHHHHHHHHVYLITI